MFYMKSARILFASDFAPIRHFAPVMRDNPTAVYGNLLSRIQNADYSIVNLESPLCCPDGLITKSGAAFSGEPEHISSLTVAGFKAVVCANNHTFDSGVNGFRQTVELLRANQIATVGAGENLEEASRELAFTVNGIKFALFAISEGEDMLGATAASPGVRPWEVEKLAAQIRESREKYDIILISAHCGLEYQPYPSCYVYEAFKLWAEAGADMIIGHHPHVPQGMTFFGKTPAYFSLGNFVFYQPVDFFHRKTGYFLEFECREQLRRLCEVILYRVCVSHYLGIFKSPERAKHIVLNVGRHRGGKALNIHFVGVKSTGLNKELVSLLILKPHELGFY